ncbi:hypothetical protein COCNU_contig69214386G000020 [Cocos nucifera]|nr:hypothetical protein [Cocos nucifera]
MGLNLRYSNAFDLFIHHTYHLDFFMGSYKKVRSEVAEVHKKADVAKEWAVQAKRVEKKAQLDLANVGAEFW